MLNSHLELFSTTNRERLTHPGQRAQEQSGPIEEEAWVGHLFQFLFFPMQRLFLENTKILPQARHGNTSREPKPGSLLCRAAAGQPQSCSENERLLGTASRLPAPPSPHKR